MYDILIAFAIVSAVGLIAGILLALLSHLLHIEDDKTVKAVRECLPGINCGACGFKGCDDYAAALAEGKAKPNLCVPGGQAAADEIGNILGITVEPLKDVVAFVHCNGNCEVTTKKAVYEGVKTCRAASQVYGGPDTCRFGCIGFGDCATACPSNAICMRDGIAHVDTSRCLGCGLCQTICPKKLISMVPQETAAVIMCNNKDKGADARKVCKNACIGCKKCEKTCPQNAITVVDNLAKIDYDKCTGCGACMQSCPTGCLKKVFFPNLEEAFGPENL